MVFKRAKAFLFNKAIAFLGDERGSLDQMVWVLGGAVIVVAVLIVLLPAAKTLAGTWWTDITNYIQSSLGFVGS